ncbi:arabinan endo-1,5-alpha-L-arabinosidase [Myxococcota bacterium]|nr:arabinan endo-1,5-alpha-L-arabinosidase [Myxococcota bacterium]
MTNTERAVAIILACSVSLACSEEALDCRLNENIVNAGSDISPIHDPSMIKADGSYYIYSSSQLGSFYTSSNMRDWSMAGTIFDEIPSWLREQIPGADHIGSPDISYYDGQYLLFYQSHESETCNAATGLAINAALDPESPHYSWTDRGQVLRSTPYLSSIDVICGDDEAIFNAIDAHFFQDIDGRVWLVFGSTIGGIKLIELDPSSLTLLPKSDYITLAQRFLLQKDPVIEGAHIVHRNGYYYLFLSFNHCCKGEDTAYQVRVGRAKKVTGPYYDKSGWPLEWGGGTLVIARDGSLIGTGHSAFFSEEDTDWLVHHAKDSENDFLPILNIRKIEWGEDLWPSVCREVSFGNAGGERDAATE